MRPGIDVSSVSEWREGAVHTLVDYLAVEEPLEIRVSGRPLTVTMRTPGNDPELAAGFLFTEGLIQNRDQLAAIRQTAPNVVEADLDGVTVDRKRMRRNFFAASSCGVCGKATIDSLRLRGLRRPSPDLRVSPALLCSLPDRLRASQDIFGRTGGLHAAALFDHGGGLTAVREDIGRHNAVDKVMGWALFSGRLPLSEQVLMISGRGGFEIVQKALAAGLPVVACVSAPSSLAVRLANEFGLTLVGFLRGQRFLAYSGAERLRLESEPAEKALGAG